MSRGRAGLTFPEILVALMIVGILLALLDTGGWHRSNESANKTTGLNNLKQIGLALQIYQDREGRFPPYDGDRFLAAVYASGDISEIKLFMPHHTNQAKFVPPPVESRVKAILPGCFPSMAAYRNATSCLKDWTYPSVCAIACDTMPNGTGPYGNGHTRCVLYQGGSAKLQNDLTIGSTNGDPGGERDLSMLQMD